MNCLDRGLAGGGLLVCGFIWMFDDLSAARDGILHNPLILWIGPCIIVLGAIVLAWRRDDRQR